MPALAFALRPFRLRLARPLETAHGLIEAREGVLIEARDGEGRTGFGEVAPLPAFGTESLQSALELLDRAIRRASGARPPDGAGAAESIVSAAQLPSSAPASLCGLEQALLDLAARRRGLPLFRLLAEAFSLAPPAARVPVSVLLSERPLGALAAEAGAARERGFTTVKLKVAHAPLAEDVARVRAVRAAVGPACALRLDANGGFTPGQAADALAALALFAPEFCEQPVAPGQPEAWKELARLCPLAADESAAHQSELAALLSSGALVAVVLKPASLGGLLAAGRLGLRALSAGVAPIASTGLDGAVGRAGAAHLAAALGSRRAAGLGTGHLLAEDLGADPAPPLAGAIVLSEAPGLGHFR
ncbi:MAG TPA: o-succinylbenzoate synthase [Myxococcales bacterium]|jgi:o-succinylbenzoate synthase|nr:o-succinylbenzoate synthase [Myxococcales bacterium]